MAKIAITEYHVLQILFFRQIVLFASSLPSIVRHFPYSLKTNHPKQHLVRLIGSFVALACSTWAVAVLPLTTAITLGFAQVFFVALLAWYFLGEPISRQRAISVAAGFIGVVVIMRPGVNGLIEIATLIPLLGAVGAGFAVISVRKLSQTESTATLLVYQALFVGVLAGVPLFWLWVTPDFHDLMFLLSMGVLATIGQWSVVKALRLTEASVIGNIEYIKLIYAAILGYLWFSEIPDVYTIVGAAIIVSSSLVLFRHESRRNKKTGN